MLCLYWHVRIWSCIWQAQHVRCDCSVALLYMWWHVVKNVAVLCVTELLLFTPHLMCFVDWWTAADWRQARDVLDNCCLAYYMMPYGRQLRCGLFYCSCYLPLVCGSQGIHCGPLLFYMPSVSGVLYAASSAFRHCNGCQLLVVDLHVVLECMNP
jgi:hypothetical protein